MTTMTADPQAARTTTALTILERAVCLTLSCHYLGNDRKVDLQALVDAAAPEREGAGLAVDADQFRATRKLVDQKELRPVMAVFGRAKSYLRSVAISTHRIFGERSYLIPAGLVEEVDERLAAFAAEAWTESAALGDRYAAAVARQQAAQGPLFRAGDYATPERVRSAFSLEWDWVSFAAPDRLERVDMALARRARDRFEAKLSAAFDETVATLRGDALRLVSELADWLAPPPPGGKPKVLRGEALGRLQDYVARLPQRNVVDDAALPAALGRVQALVEGVAVQDLRDSAALRDAVRGAAEQARVVLAGLVEEAPSRAISFGPLA